MPSKSYRQHRFMQIASHDPEFAKKHGISKDVADEFLEADQEAGKYQSKHVSEEGFDPQEELDAALHDVHETAEEVAGHLDAMDYMEQTLTTLEGLKLQLESSLEAGASYELLCQTQVALESSCQMLGDYEALPVPVSLEAFESDVVGKTRVSLEDVASTIAKYERAMTAGVNHMFLSIHHFFAGTQRVSNRALDALAHADNLLDHPGTPATKKLSFTGAAAKALQCGKRTVSLREACQLTHTVGKETVEHWVPQLIQYANGMAQAFAQSDLSRVRDALGLSKRGFMERAQAFAHVKPVVPAFCTVPGNRRYFFGSSKEFFQQTSSSEPLPGNRVVEVTHPVGDLKKLLDREDTHGFFEAFPHWLSVDVRVAKIPGPQSNPTMVDVPGTSELREDINQVREVAKGLRTLSVKSAEVQRAMDAMLDAYEEHVYKRWDTTMNKIANIPLGVFNMYGSLALGSSSSMYQTILQMGKYLSSECHGLATVALKCAKTYKTKE